MTYAIDTLVFDFHIVSDPKEYNLSIPPDDGCYISGLFLEGARWSSEDRVLEESFPKILYNAMPVIWLKPLTQDEQAKDRHVPQYHKILFNFI
jgi:dynein heavy chain, axonemal